EVVRLIERLRAARAVAPPSKPNVSSSPPSSVETPPQVATKRDSGRRMLWIAGAAVLLALGTLVARRARQSATPSPTTADKHARSPVAERLYADGLRAFFQFDSDAAARLFNDAIKEDSSFAMAVYFSWRSEAR